MTTVRKLIVLSILLMCGCGPSVSPMGSTTPVKGSLSVGGKTVGDVVLTLQPAGDGHVTPLSVASNGTFSGEATPGEYFYYVGKSSAKNSEQVLKTIAPKYYDTDANRKVKVAPGQELTIALD
jgi:hypothetical protein